MLCVVAAGGACCALFSLTPHTCSPCPLPRPFSLAAVQDGKLPKDLAETDAIKALLAKAYEEAMAPLIAEVARAMREHRTARAAVKAGVDRRKIVRVAMEDDDVMAWLLATIPEYAKEKGRVRGSSPLSRRSLASLARVRLSFSLTPRVCHTRHSCVFCVLPCAVWGPAAPRCRSGKSSGGDKGAARRLPGRDRGEG